MSWYSVEKINETFYRISEDKHWERTNLYYFIGEKRNILFDTGTGIKPLKALLEKIDDKPIDVILSHAHWDHLGNIHEFEDVYVHPNDMEWVKLGLPLPDEKIIEMMTKDVDGEYLEGFKLPPLKHATPMDVTKYDFGGLSLIETPGHSPGSICLYDQVSKSLFSGDTIYEGTVYCHFESTDPVKLDGSISKINELEVKTVYPGHYSVLNADVIEDLASVLNEYKREDILHHGGGKKCMNKVCVQL